MAKEKYEGGSWQTATGAAIGRALAEHHAQPSLESQLAALRKENRTLNVDAIGKDNRIIELQQENAGLAALVERYRLAGNKLMANSSHIRCAYWRPGDNCTCGLADLEAVLSTTPSAALALVRTTAANEMLHSICGSIRAYPDGGCDIEVAAALAEHDAALLEKAARIVRDRWSEDDVSGTCRIVEGIIRGLKPQVHTEEAAR